MKTVNKTRIAFVASLVILLGMALSACNLLPQSEPPLRVGTNIWPGYEPLYLARHLRAWGDAPVHLVEFNSATDVAHAMRNHNLEAAALTLDETLSLLQDGVSLRVILVLDVSDGGDVLLAKPEIKAISQLRGKRVAVENTAVGAILLDGALQSAGLSVDDISIISCTVDKHENCYRQADAIVTFEPVKSRLQKQGANLLFDSSRIPDRIIDILVVTEDAIEQNPKTLQQLLQGYFAARQYMATHPTQAAAIMAPRMGIPAEEVLGAFDGLHLPDADENRQLLSARPPAQQDIAQNMMQLMLKRRLIRQAVDVNNLAEGRFVESLQP